MNVNELTFGIEIETTIPAELVRSGRVTIGAYHVGRQVNELPPGWTAQHDGSIHANRNRVGCEFVSPVLRGAEGIEQILFVLRWLKTIGATVNQSTGLHVHVGWTFDAAALDRLISLTGNFERAIFASTGTKHRERGHYCQRIQGYGDCQRAREASTNYRYHVLNLTNLQRSDKRTVEFRAFSGTLNPVKLIGYVRLCLGLVERAMAMARKTNWTAKTPVSSSPIHRSGEGQTALCRLFYQLGWIKGRRNHVYGNLDCPESPDLKAIKAQLMRLARKYDEQT